jgi:exonuclease III
MIKNNKISEYKWLTSEIDGKSESECKSAVGFQIDSATYVKIAISVVAINAIIVHLLLLQQNVEPNPGPTKRDQTSSILTYNTNSLGDRNKFKRLLLKLEPIVNKGGIVLRQETHIVNPKILKTSWKNCYAMNGSTTNSAGLIILYSDQYKIIEEYSDKKGRQLIIAIEKEDEENIIVVNAYFPNNHKQSFSFADQLYEKIIQFQQNYPDYHTIFAGDLNTCLSKREDSLNRNQSKNVEIIANLIVENNKVINLVDEYRRTEPNSGFTWKRGDCYSRLDYIIVSNGISHRISGSKLDWAFESSDHAALLTDILLEDTPKKGPGLTKLNTKILENAEVTKKIGEEIEDMMSQTDKSWNPHTKLEFLKVCIRSVFVSKVSEIRGQMKKTIEEK